MTVLHLGVTDIPYAAAQRAARRRAGQKPSTPSRATTGDVAEILERRYGIMAAFFEMYGEKIADALAGVVLDKFEALALGMRTPGSNAPLFEEGDLGEVEQLFRSMLDKEELNGRPGVPTQAALNGVSHRMLHPYEKRGPRASFIDTGLYQSSMRAWMDE